MNEYVASGWGCFRLLAGLALGIVTLGLVYTFLQAVGWKIIGYEAPLEVLDPAWFDPAPTSRLVVDLAAGVLAAFGSGIVAARASGYRSVGYGLGLFVSSALGLLILVRAPHNMVGTPQPAALWFDALFAVALGMAIAAGGWIAVDGRSAEPPPVSS